VINPSGVEIDNLVSTDNESHILVKSNETPKKSGQYKVLPGVYYVRARAQGGDFNGYGTVTLSATPVTEDPGGEPNDDKASAKPIKFDTTYKGNIGYQGKATSNARDFGQDKEDFYRITVPKNSDRLRITFSRTNDGKEKNILEARLMPVEGAGVEDRINLKAQFSATKEFSLKTKGNYYLCVYGHMMAREGTEYSFKVEVVKVPVSKVKLNKTSLKLKKGKAYQLKATLSPANVYSGYKKVTWKSSNKNVVKVSGKGKITALKKGTATITVKTHNGKTAKCKVRVV
jgi:uncharacterized protein YjdB